VFFEGIRTNYGCVTRTKSFIITVYFLKEVWQKMNTLGKKLFIALFGLMAIGAIGGVMVAGYAIVIEEPVKMPASVPTPTSAPAQPSSSS